MLVIRLSRTGRRNQPKYRVVVTEDSSKIQGKPVAVLGYYMPTALDKKLVLDLEAVRGWIAKGAKPSNTVSKILNGQGFDLPVHKYQPSKAKKAPQEEAPKAQPVAEAEVPAASEEALVAEDAVTEQAEPAVEEAAAVETESALEAPEAEAVVAAEEDSSSEAGDEPVA